MADRLKSLKAYKPLQLISVEDVGALRDGCKRIGCKLQNFRHNHLNHRLRSAGTNSATVNDGPKKIWKFDKDIFLAQVLDASIVAGVAAVASWDIAGPNVAFVIKVFLGMFLLKMKEYRKLE